MQWLFRRREPSAQLARWLEVLSEYSYEIVHRAGPLHGNADGLSRRPHTDCDQCSNVEKRDGGPTMLEVVAELQGELTNNAEKPAVVDRSADMSVSSIPLSRV